MILVWSQRRAQARAASWTVTRRSRPWEIKRWFLQKCSIDFRSPGAKCEGEIRKLGFEYRRSWFLLKIRRDDVYRVIPKGFSKPIFQLRLSLEGEEAI